ncbi:MAG: FAD-dependent 5-carboxymethylaminomethyl-2-thiouridine(34) oxidoreductase MnmC, partial [Neisseria sp.]|nr:FAD-dependent 5-carboxymethylaminomethyl-2-thiouridine(34) oxidoreductase MnmC [Neisseria sp.]
AERFRRLAVCLPDETLPQPADLNHSPLAGKWRQQTACLQFSAVNLLTDLLPDAELWLLPPAVSWRDYFSDGLAVWQTEIPPAPAPKAVKPWFAPPVLQGKTQHVAVIGAGISGAATAYALARRGVRVTVLETGKAANAASGNRQGLLYAKISPHPTEQTELLLGGYGYTRRLLETLLPDSDAWQPCGVFHLNHNAAEAKRNAKLAGQSIHKHLYRAADARDIARISGLRPSENQDGTFSDGLYWPQGVWLHPPALVRALLAHPLIELREHCPLTAAEWQDAHWQITTPQGCFTADHLVYCTGADNPEQPPLAALPWQLIRGQTSLAEASGLSAALSAAWSGASYISPAWQGIHCFGATFTPHDNGRDWREADELHNRRELAELAPELAASLAFGKQQGHAAVRCDCPDHLPAVGPLGDAAAMMQTYAKLSSDKNYRIDTPCPYQPNVWVNSAHGSRGLATAPWCAEALAAMICREPNPLSPRLREALHPNRHIIRALVRQGK